MPVAPPGPRQLRQVAVAVNDNRSPRSRPTVADQVICAAYDHLPLPFLCANLAIKRENFIMLATTQLRVYLP
jgi:hypothetical protein